MKHYWVISPEYEYKEVILDDGSGPMMVTRCSCCVEASNKRQAKILAIQHKDMQEWIKLQRDDKKNPFVGLEVMNAKCKHGICFCEFDDAGEYCEECDKENQCSL